ncbi:MAG: helix-turn-helix domain-containing protein [Candidatus Lokiarchaeota archaeon]|nr:helix-turn-helix domain-containing protein [Candidatus Lokiarchaeota archaeon]
MEEDPRKKEIIYYAAQHGYFELPHKIDSEAIAENFKISKSAINEHLRKID